MEPSLKSPNDISIDDISYGDIIISANDIDVNHNLDLFIVNWNNFSISFQNGRYID